MSKLKKSILAIIIVLISTFIVGATANIVYGITGYVMLGTWQPGYTDGSCNSAIWSFTYPECEEGCGVQQQSTRDYVYRPATCTHDVEETYTVDVTDDEGNVTQETRTRTVKKTFQHWEAYPTANIGDDEAIFCIQHDQLLDRHGNYYKELYTYTIEGLNAYLGPYKGISGIDDIDGAVNHRLNAVLAYILNQPRGTYDDLPGMNSNPVQDAVWQVMPNWMDQVGSQLNIANVFPSGTPSGVGSSIVTEGEEYADELERIKNMKDNTDKENIDVQPYRKDGVKYMQVGPFNTTFGGDLTQVLLSDGNGNGYDATLFGKYEGTTFVTMERDEIETDKDYYILIPLDKCNMHWIKNIKWKVEYDEYVVTIKLSVVDGSKTGENDHGQAIIEITPSKERGEKELEVEFNIPLMIDISGFVWEDIKSGKDNEYDDVFHQSAYQGDSGETYDGADTLVEGIVVNLIDRETGEIVRRIVPSSQGGSQTGGNSGNEGNTGNTDNPQGGNTNTPDVDDDYYHDENTAYVDPPEDRNNTTHNQNTAGDQQTSQNNNNNNTSSVDDDYYHDSDTAYVDPPEDRVKTTVGSAANDDYYHDENTAYVDPPEDRVDGNQTPSGSGNQGTTNGTGEEITAITDENGAYKFEDLFISELEFYYIQFIYNGVTYTAVMPLVGEDRSINSKADEIPEQRKEINDTFAEITNADDITARDQGFARDASGNVTHHLKYNNITEENRSELAEITDEPADVIADTEQTGYDLREEFDQEHYIVNDQGDLEIQYNNLGLIRREQPETAISKDLVNAQIDVNGYSHIYDYAKRYEYLENNSAFNVAVKFGNEYIDSYTRAIYPSDVQFSIEGANGDDARKLKVYVTYSITVRNMSDTLTTEVNELVDYYDANYTIVDSWFGNAENPDERGDTIEWSTTSKYGQSYSNNGYVAAYTTSTDGKQIPAGNNLDTIYIKFQVNDETVLGLLKQEATLENVTEIYSYSTFYGRDDEREQAVAGDVYAGVDRASAPGNATPGNVETYEADTDKAPSFILDAKGVRQIEGTVFEDNAIDADGNIMSKDEVYTNQVRKGDGIYNKGSEDQDAEDAEKGENIIRNVKVELLTVNDGVIGDVAEIYPNSQSGGEDPDKPDGVEGGSSVDAVVYSDDNGNYKFAGIEPGNYIIRFTYANGNEIYTTDGTQAGVIDVQNYKSTIITSEKLKNAFINGDKEWYKNDKQYMGDKAEEPRYSDARDNYDIRQAIDDQIKDVTNITQDNLNQDQITEMEADTPEFEIGVEKYQYSTIYTETAKDAYVYKVSDVDFGIILRAQQAAEVDKHVKHVKVTLANGQILIDGDPRTENLEYVMYLPDTKQIYITIDNELLYGAQLEITYEFTLTNTSEKDYISEDNYFWGDEVGDLITFDSATLIDYVDLDMTISEESSGTWTPITTIEELLRDHNTNLTQIDALLQNFSSVVTTEGIHNGALAPGESANTDIKVQRLLATSDDLAYENNGEIIRIQKNGGSSITTDITSYGELTLWQNPTAEPGEIDETKAETVTVIPPTGDTLTYVAYIATGIAALAVLGVGIVVIRKIVKL